MFNTIFFLLAFVLFAVSAYMTHDVPAKLERLGFAAAALALLLGTVIH